MLHQDIIANRVKEFEKYMVSLPKPMSSDQLLTLSPFSTFTGQVSIKIFHGGAHTIVWENTFLLQDTL